MSYIFSSGLFGWWQVQLRSYIYAKRVRNSWHSIWGENRFKHCSSSAGQRDDYYWHPIWMSFFFKLSLPFLLKPFFLGRNMLESLESHGFFWLLICNYPTTTQELPEAKDSPQVCGKTANGCRLAFDLGKSDIKTVAVKDGEAHLGRGLRWSDENSSLQQLSRADISISFIILDDQEVQRLSFLGDASWCFFDFDFGPITSRICDDSGISQYHHNLLK